MRVPERDTVLVIAHRGSSGTAPENTMAAFREAAASGADMIELDVRLTRDFEPVVVHDRTFRRTAGARLRVWEANLADIRRLDAGGWFAPRFRGEPVPTLREVLAWLPEALRLNIEVKTDGDPRPADVTAEACVAAIAERPAGRDLLVSSFDSRLLRHLGRLLPGLTLGALYVPLRDARHAPSAVARASCCRVFICSRVQLRRRMAPDLHRRGIMLFCYTVNDHGHLTRAIARGVDGVITDYPARLRRLLATGS